MKYDIRNNKTAVGALSFRLRTEEKWAPTSVEDLIAVDIEGPEYEKYDARIPLAEMGDTFLSFYEDMAAEKGNEIIGYAGRGLKPGDWILLHMFKRPHQSESYLNLLVTNWRHKGALEDYVGALVWHNTTENALYLMNPGFPNPELKGKLKNGTSGRD